MLAALIPSWALRTPRVPGEPSYIFFTGSDIDPNEFELFSLGSDIFSTLAVATLSIGSDMIDTGIDAGFAIQEETYNPPSAGFAIEVTDQMLLDAADPNGV